MFDDLSNQKSHAFGEACLEFTFKRHVALRSHNRCKRNVIFTGGELARVAKGRLVAGAHEVDAEARSWICADDAHNYRALYATTEQC